MEFSVKVEGLERIGQASQEVRDAIARELKKGLYASAKKVEADAKRSIAGSAGKMGGRFYKRRGVLHQASAPGEPPSTDTGRLVNSISGELDTRAPGEANVKAGGGIVKYARFLEFGTAKMAARPFLFPALEKNKAWIKDRLDKAVRTAVIGVVRKGRR